MAMLAEQRSKQKWSDDPRNIKWSSDKERYGYQMLEKMGWASGNGLGRKQSGSTSHVKIKKRKQNLGLGAKECHDKDWIAQQDDFNNLLSALQQHSGNAELRSEEQNNKAMLQVAKASRKRVFYKKFIRSKDTSQYSQKDMACIFGSLPSQSAPATPLSQSEDEVESEDSTASCPTIPCNSTSGFVTYTSKQNIQEYFACRMRELQDVKGERGQCEDNVGDEETYAVVVDEAKGRGKKRQKLEDFSKVETQKTKKRKKSKIDVKQEDEDTGDREENFPEKNLCEERVESSEKMNEKKRKKKSKRSKVKGFDELKISPSVVESEEKERKVCDEEGEECRLKNRKSKKRVKKDNQFEDMNVSQTITNGEENVTEENEKTEGGQEDFSCGNEDKIKTKKRKKGKRNVEVKSLDGSEMVVSGIEDDENLCEEETVSFVKDKVKRKKNKKPTKDVNMHDLQDSKDETNMRSGQPGMITGEVEERKSNKKKVRSKVKKSEKWLR